MHLSFTPENVAILLTLLGPGVVAAITGLKTPSWVKALLAVVMLTALTAYQVLATGLSGDIIKDFAQGVSVWVGAYTLLFKSTAIGQYLQEKVPVYIGHAEELVDQVDVIVDKTDDVVDGAGEVIDNAGDQFEDANEAPAPVEETPAPVEEAAPEQTDNTPDADDGDQADVPQVAEPDLSGLEEDPDLSELDGEAVEGGEQ